MSHLSEAEIPSEEVSAPVAVQAEAHPYHEAHLQDLHRSAETPQPQGLPPLHTEDRLLHKVHQSAKVRLLPAAIQEERQAATQEAHRIAAQAMTEATPVTAEAVHHPDQATAGAVHHLTEEAAIAEAADLLQEAATAGVHQEVTDVNIQRI